MKLLFEALEHDLGISSRTHDFTRQTGISVADHLYVTDAHMVTWKIARRSRRYKDAQGKGDR